MLKNKKDAGADQLTPSVPQYFSWINNTNEGATEAQTLVNLDFFRYMKEEYGMTIRIYAWDAGNFDGAAEGYGDLNSEKFKAQYPEEYVNVVKKADELGIRMGLWGSPDGFGDTPEEEKERFDFYVHLCRDYGFALFKIDGVCGQLRPEKAGVFAKMLQECRKYSPDLIVLNHRLPLYEAEPYVTTYLLGGAETYVDVHLSNGKTAMHNREYMFTRGHTENLDRLAEDHGVCLSASMDYFEDELIYQAFGRCLIVAPEIYGNPWLLRDDELPKLARIYNLHARNAAILVEGKILSESYGASAVSRGSEEKRFIATGNDSWEKMTIKVKIGEEIGLATDKPVAVNLHHPYEQHLGTFKVGDEVEIELMPYRAALIEVAAQDAAEPMLENCAYEIIREDKNGTPVEVRTLRSADGSVDIMERAPRYLGSLDHTEKEPANGEFLYENAMFAIGNDTLEARSAKRAGATAIPEVQAARDAFFDQLHYRLRGGEARWMFDGDDNTFFDCFSRVERGRAIRIDGGCLRVDYGKAIDCDKVEIEFFVPDAPTREVPLQNIPYIAEYSNDLKEWKLSAPMQLSVANDAFTIQVVRFTKHTLYDLPGKKLVATYEVNDALRYLRIAEPMDRIYAVRLIKDGVEVKLTSVPFASNLQAHARRKPVALVKSGEITLPELDRPSYLAVGINGEHEDECVYCVAECEGKFIGFPRRAPDYKANHWEHWVRSTNENHTFFMDISQELSGKTITVRALLHNAYKANVHCDVYLCDKH